MFGIGKKGKREKKGTEKLKVQPDLLGDLIIEKALRENREKQAEIINLQSNIEVLQTSIDNIKAICKKSKTSKVAKVILNELGE